MKPPKYIVDFTAIYSILTDPDFPRFILTVGILSATNTMRYEIDRIELGNRASFYRATEPLFLRLRLAMQ